MPATRLSADDYTGFIYPPPGQFGAVFGITAEPIVISIPFGPQNPNPPSLTIANGLLTPATLPESVVNVFKTSQGLDGAFGTVLIRRLMYHDIMWVLQKTNRIAPVATNPHHIATLACPPLVAFPCYTSAPDTGFLHDPAWMLHSSTSQAGGLDVDCLKALLTPSAGTRARATDPQLGHCPSASLHCKGHHPSVGALPKCIPICKAQHGALPQVHLHRCTQSHTQIMLV
jgi:hypothetical protein